MDEETQTVEQTTPEPAAEPTVASVPAEEPAAPETAEPPKPEPKYVDWREALADADPDELLKDPRVAGRIGQVADARARKLAEQRIAEQEAERQRAADRALRDSDPYKYAEVQRTREQQDFARQQEMQRANAIGSVVTKTLAEYAQEVGLSEDVLKAAAEEADGKPLDQGLKTWVAKTHQGMEAALRKKWEAEELPVLRKKLLAELNGGEPPVQVGGGQAGKGALDFATEEEMAAAHMAGRITTDQARQWHLARRGR